MLKIIKAEYRRSFIELLNYYPDQIVDILVKFILFCAFLSTNPSQEKGAVFLWSYLFWIFASTVISETSTVMSSEKQIGTIEHLLMMPSDIITISIIRTYSVITIGLLKGLLLAIMVRLTLSIHLAMNLQVLLIFIISLFGFTGLGLLMSGLTLKYAKVASFESLLSYGLLLLTGVVSVSNNVLFHAIHYIPFRLGIVMFQESITQSITSFDWLMLCIGNVVLFIIGFVIFKIFLKQAKTSGIVAQY